MLFVASASGQSADEKRAAIDPYWLGPFFAGLPLSEEREDPVPEFAYGDCISEGEGGCPWPARVETSTTCALNPISHETPFAPVSSLRGGGLMTEDEWPYVGTGYRTFTIETGEPELRTAALREARRHSQPGPEPLPPPVYPITVLRELKRVAAAAARLRGVKAIAKETELNSEQVRYRLRVAKLLGPEALAGVPVPTMSTARVQRLIQLSNLVRLYPTRTAEKNGMTVAELRKLVSRVRGLTGFC
jgi:DNA-binding phage protein